jgi:hypothetical protein
MNVARADRRSRDISFSGSIPMMPRISRHSAASILCIAIALCAAIIVADARSARCFATDEGSYACEFRSTGSDGSFEISARGKPTYSLTIDSPGVAFGFVNLGGRNTALPGRYKRSTSEPGCWVNDTTSAKICAQ